MNLQWHTITYRRKLRLLADYNKCFDVTSVVSCYVKKVVLLSACRQCYTCVRTGILSLVFQWKLNDSLAVAMDENKILKAIILKQMHYTVVSVYYSKCIEGY